MVGKIKRWQWIALSVLIGFALPFIRGRFDGELYGLDVKGYGYRLANQGRFEDALVQEFEGRRQFKDITVYPLWATQGGWDKRVVYLVAGSYYNGRPEPQNGEFVERWRPACFVASVPYRPLGFPGGATAEQLSRFAGLKAPTVLDYLDVVNAIHGVKYRYAWWNAWPRLTWIAGSVLLIGVIWPTLINLMLYGMCRRPTDENQIDLTDVRISSHATHNSPSTAVDFSCELDAELEMSLKRSQDSNDDLGPSKAPSVQPLSADSLEPAQSMPEAPRPEFGKKPEDFYPTERHRVKGGSE